MPFDPSLPAPNSPLESQVIRDQLQALFALINNIVSVSAAQVDGVNTLPPSSPANASVSVVGNTLHFTFELPQGQEGPMGQQGPPFANAFVDAVNTVGPGDPASVGVSFDGTNVRFTFNIPRGNDGSQGPPGNDGGQGPQGNDGAQGPPFAQAVVDGVTTLDPGQQGRELRRLQCPIHLWHPTRQRWRPRRTRRSHPSPAQQRHQRHECEHQQRGHAGQSFRRSRHGSDAPEAQ